MAYLDYLRGVYSEDILVVIAVAAFGAWFLFLVLAIFTGHPKKRDDYDD